MRKPFVLSLSKHVLLAASRGGRPSTGSARTAGSRPAQGGFTLVELMVVIAVIGLVSAAAVLAMPDPRGRLMDEAARFAMRARAAHDTAIVDARPVSLWVTPSGYGFDEWRGGRWMPMAQGGFRVGQWGQGVAATGIVRERIVFDPTGLADRPLTISLRRDGGVANVAIAADGSVRVVG